MDANKELRVFEKLCTFKFGRDTDTNKGVLNNRDAAAFLFWHIGPTSSKEMTSLLRKWRGKVPHYSGGMTDLSYTYLFNTSDSGNYGNVAPNAMYPGHWMHTNGGGIARRFAGDDTKGLHFRRTYWYRIERGLYAATVECAKRMTELGLGSEIE